MEHLAARGLTCPQPVKDRAGETLGMLAGRPAALVTFLDGMWIRRPAVWHCAALGEALAKLHHRGRGFFRPRARTRSRSKAGGRSTRPPSAAPIRCKRASATTIAAELDHVEQAWPRGLPPASSTPTCFPTTCSFSANALSGIIDFYFACTDTLAYDVAICLNAWCFEPDHSFNVTKGRALLQGYGKVRPLSDAEQAALPTLSRGAALRFLLTRLVDWLNVPPGALVKPKDPLEYFRKLRFHQAVANAGDYGLAA